MHVLVVGGNRFLGRLLVHRLLAGGHAVTLVNRGTLADPFGERVERLRADRTTPELERVLAGRRFDATVDFVAFTGDDGEQVVRLLRRGVLGHHVMISTGQVYLVRQDCPRPSREEDYDGPLAARPAAEPDAREWDYGAGKRACEDALARASALERLPATRVRIPVVHGEADPTRRLDAYLWRLQDAHPVLVPDGGTHRVRHVYAEDVARTIAALLGREAVFGKAFNLAQEETPTLLELLGLLRELLGSRSPLVVVPRDRIAAAGLDLALVSPFSGKWQSFLDPSWAKDALGFTPTPLERSLASIVASVHAHAQAPPRGYDARAREVALATGSGP